MPVPVWYMKCQIHMNKKPTISCIVFFFLNVTFNYVFWRCNKFWENYQLCSGLYICSLIFNQLKGSRSITFIYSNIINSAGAMSSLKAAKGALRKQVKATLNELSQEEKTRQSAIVSKHLLESATYRQARRLSIFLSMHDEIDTDQILKNALNEGKQCFIPR